MLKNLHYIYIIQSFKTYILINFKYLKIYKSKVIFFLKIILINVLINTNIINT